MKVISRSQAYKHIRRPMPKATRVDENKASYQRKGKYPNDYLADALADAMADVKEFNELMEHFDS